MFSKFIPAFLNFRPILYHIPRDEKRIACKQYLLDFKLAKNQKFYFYCY